MELLELKTKLLAIFNLETVEEMPDYLMQHLNDEQNRILAELRDTLAHKLLSGEIEL